MFAAIITGVLGLLGKLFGWLTRKDERDISHDQGEALGVAETQAATAQAAIREAKDAVKTEDDVRGLSDRELNDELRGP
jgi:hypothetical protein